MTYLDSETFYDAASEPSDLAGPGAVRTRRARRLASFGILLAAIVNLVSALTPATRRFDNYVSDQLPLALNQTAALVTALSGLALVQLARGVRRGQRNAWLASVVLLGISVTSHLLKGLDYEEATVGVVLALYLIAKRRYFRARSDAPSTRLAVLALLGGTLASVAVAVVAMRFSGPGIPLPRAVLAAAERLIGFRTIALSGRVGRLLTPALGGVGIALVLGTGWLLVRPTVKAEATSPADTDDAHRIVAAYGSDSLDYFALRSDKVHHIVGDTLVAYAVYNGVCLVSPDPIGPADQRGKAWANFLDVVHQRGWILGVLGASEGWLAVYRQADMDSRYIGDEAIVDVDRFTLDGGEMKSLRQAVNRIAKNGYTISFHDPSNMDATLAMALRALMSESRKGDVERGFSMTLSRLFDPCDRGLLLAICHGPNGAPAAFCQFVPAGPRGYSLDLMRRSLHTSTGADHPNGLTDFVIVRTIEKMRADGKQQLSLNFATMRAVIAGESGDGLGQRTQRWMLERMSESMQIESLWRYNAKFMPEWRRRYLVYDAPEHLVPIGLAVAKAESFWELPVIGGFMR